MAKITNFDDLKRMHARAKHKLGGRDWFEFAATMIDSFPALYETALAMNKRLETELEACAFICETLELKIDDGKYETPIERHVMAVAESGCRNAFADAIRSRKPEKEIIFTP